MKVIQSTQNQYVKTARQLKNKKFRQKSGLFLLEGTRLICEAINAGYPLEYAFVSDEIDEELVAQLCGCCETYLVSPQLLLTITETENPQGIAAVARQRTVDLSEMVPTSEEDLLMIADGVQDPGNLGTIIRTADAAGAAGIILTATTVDLYNSKTVRASMGSILRTKLAANQSPAKVTQWLASYGYKIIVGHVGAQRYYYQVDYSGKVAIVVGNENSGPSEDFKTAGVPVKIPCRTESLNVSIAAAVLLYEKVRKGSV